MQRETRYGQSKTFPDVIAFSRAPCIKVLKQDTRAYDSMVVLVRDALET
jgi:hypothetical protein